MSGCAGNQSSSNANLLALINQLFCLVKETKTSVTDCLRVTVPGPWGAFGDIIQHVRWFSSLTTFVDVYVNTVTNLVVTGVTAENTLACETSDVSCCNNIDFLGTQTIGVHDCGEFYRTVSFDVLLSAVPGNVLQIQDDGLYAQILQYTGNTVVYADTVNGADTASYTISGGGNSVSGDSTRGAFITVDGNEHVGAAGGVNIALGDVANATVDIGFGGIASSHVRMYANSILQWQTTASCFVELKNAANESTGGSAVNLGANSPAGTATPFKWVKIVTSDGSTAFIPVWK